MIIQKIKVFFQSLSGENVIYFTDCLTIVLITMILIFYLLIIRPAIVVECNKNEILYFDDIKIKDLSTGKYLNDKEMDEIWGITDDWSIDKEDLK